MVPAAMTTPRNLIDLSHTVEHGLVTSKGLPAPIICDYLSREASRKHYAPGTEFQIGKIEMVANTGTYLDSPFHRYADGKDLSQLELQKLANLPAIKIPGQHKQAVDVSCFPRGEDLAGKAVLVVTVWPTVEPRWSESIRTTSTMSRTCGAQFTAFF